jgi:hypothetical protein
MPLNAGLVSFHTTKNRWPSLATEGYIMPPSMPTAIKNGLDTFAPGLTVAPYRAGEVNPGSFSSQTIR